MRESLSIIGTVPGPLPTLGGVKPGARRRQQRFHSAGDLQLQPRASLRQHKVLYAARTGTGGEPLPSIAPSTMRGAAELLIMEEAAQCLNAQEARTSAPSTELPPLLTPLLTSAP